MNVRPARQWGFAAGLLTALSSCMLATTGPPASLGIVGARLENRTQAWLSSVNVSIPATGRFVSCGNIAPGAECATSFPEQTYTGNPVEVTWSQGGQVWSTGELTLEPDVEVFDAGNAVVRVVILGPGRAGVVMLPSGVAR